MSHTPLPWTIRHGTNIFGVRADCGHEGTVATCGGMSANTLDCGPENRANAEFIVRCVNSHEALLAALETAVRVVNEAHDHWDADRDAKVGKYLAALGGHLKGYRADVDAMHAALTLARTPAR